MIILIDYSAFFGVLRTFNRRPRETRGEISRSYFAAMRATLECPRAQQRLDAYAAREQARLVA